MQIHLAISHFNLYCYQHCWKHRSSLFQFLHSCTSFFIQNIFNVSIACISTLLVVTLISMFVIEYIIFNDLGVLQRFKNIAKISSIVFNLVVYFGQLIYTFLNCFFFYKITNFTSNFSLLDWIATISTALMIIIQSGFFIHNRLYGLISIAIPAVMMIVQINLFAILLCILSALKFYQEKVTLKVKLCLFRKLCLVLLLLHAYGRLYK